MSTLLTSVSAACSSISWPSEFQVILAGGSGASLYPLASDDAPRALLPVANRALLSYQLELIERAGISEAIVAVQAAHIAYVTALVDGKIKVDFVEVKEEDDAPAVLKKVRDKIRAEHVIVVSGDLIVDPSMLCSVARMHRSRRAALTMLLARLKPIDDGQGGQSTGLGRKAKLYPDDSSVFALDDATGRVLAVWPEVTVRSKVAVSKTILARASGAASIRSDLFDAQLYALDRWALDAVTSRDSFARPGFVPFLVRSQYSEERPAIEPDLAALMTHAAPRPPGPGCYAVVADGAAGASSFCLRVSTLPAFFEANREIAKGSIAYLPKEELQKGRFLSKSAQIDPMTQVGAECVVGDSSEIGGRCGVKHSVVGRHCTIAASAKIANSVLMDNVTIGEGAAVSDCVLCSGAVVKAKAALKDCIVGYGCAVETNSKVEGETLLRPEA